MRISAERHGTALLWVIAAGLVVAAATAPVALKVIDEAIYYGAALAMARDGTLAVENGWDSFGAGALLLRFMNAGPNGIVPQYPPGQAVLAAPLVAPLGMRGLLLLNALAAAATLFATRALARAAFADEGVALAGVLILALATFWAEFAFGVWPHALATLFVTLALLCLLRGIGGGPGAWRWAGLAGLAVGAGMLVRTDSVLILPVLAAATILFAPRHWAMLAAGAAGAAPALALAAAANAWKFGTWNPLSYGTEGRGGTVFASHFDSLALMLIGLNALLVLRRLGWRPRRSVAWAAIGAALLVLAVATPFRDVLASVARGGWRLVVDARLLSGPEIADIDGTRLFWGLPKKALGQSLPWIGLLAVLVTLRMAPRDGRSVAILLGAAVLWVVPFAADSWYGGYGSNMRYFLPILPVLAVLAGFAWHRLAGLSGAALSPLAVGGLCGAVLVAAWYPWGPGGAAGANQILPLGVLAVAAPLALAAGLAGTRSPLLAHVAQAAAAIGLAVAVANAASDLRVDRLSRALIARAVADLEPAVPARSLVYGRPELFPFQFSRPDGLLALPTHPDGRDTALIVAAVRAGYRTFVAADQLDRVLALGRALEPAGPPLGYADALFVELRLRPGHMPSPADPISADPAPTTHLPPDEEPDP